MRKVDIFGVNYTVTDYDAASELIIENAKKRKSFVVFALPVHGVIERRRDAEFKKAVDEADLIVPDGQPIKWAMNFFHGTRLKDRVYGPYLTSAVLEKANHEGLSVFLYGGSSVRVLDEFRLHIQCSYPNVEIVGTFREEVFGQNSLDLDYLRKTKPNIVLVGLGCPSQEKWISNNKSDIDVVAMGVGAAFSFYAGETKMAPVWMQEKGLEWLFRLVNEPRRLWRRYLYTNSYFIWLVVTEFYKSIVRRS